MNGPVIVTEKNAKQAAEILTEFLKPFEESEIKLKPAKVSNNRALALAYIDARLVLDRLDEVVGLAGWKDEYTLLPTGEVECRLSVRVAGEWITKADVGGKSEQPDEGDQMKAAYSDALKRAAVKFGIGRFLYRRPQQWMDYDPVKKQIVRPGTPQPQKAEPEPQPSDWAVALGRRLLDAKSREEGGPLWAEYDRAMKSGKVRAQDKKFVDAAFAVFAKKFPKSQPAKA